MIVDPFGFVLSVAVTQVVAHLRARGAFDENLFGFLKNVSELLFGHQARDELFEHLLAELRPGRFAARCGCLGLARHENSFGGMLCLAHKISDMLKKAAFSVFFM